MEGHCSTGQSPQWAVVPMEEEEDYGMWREEKMTLNVIFRPLKTFMVIEGC